jgi:hypothetical protein
MGFIRFWYDFIVGDDWTVAAGVIITFAVAGGLVDLGVPAWWVVPLGVTVLLAASLWRATRPPRPPRTTAP